MPTPPRRAKSAPLLIGLVTLLAGCTTTSPQPSVKPTMPTPPAQLMRKPPPSDSWSERAAADIEMWRQKLAASQANLPASSSGQPASAPQQ